MSHTKLTCGGVRWHYNSDMSGDITVEGPNGGSTTVTFSDMLHLFAEHERSRRIEALEERAWTDLVPSTLRSLLKSSNG